MSLAIYFVVDGAAVGKGRPRVSTIGGRPRMYTPAKTMAWERLVSEGAAGAMGSTMPSEQQWSIRICIFMPVPVSWPRRRQEAALQGLEHPGKPDLDNVAKAVLDGLNGIVYRDDKQVTRLVVEKRYDLHPRTEVYGYEVCK